MPAARIMFAAVIVMAALLVAAPAWAGGWAVTTLDRLPDQVVAGEPVSVGFVVRQHGLEAREGLSPSVGATHRETRRRITASVVEDRPAHYTATLTFPSEGQWTWWIDGFGRPQPMPSLTVLPAAQASGQGGAGDTLPLIGTLGGAAGLVAGTLMLARWQRAGMALLGLSAAVMAAALIPTLGGSPAAAAEAEAQPEVDQAATGEALFVAKGCVVCHSNSRAEMGAFESFDIGPNLSAYNNSPDFLRHWLKDPRSAKPGAMMPDLGLHEDEIEALIAFLNSSE